MKKIITLAVGLLVLISCKKDENNNDDNWPDYLVGTWSLDDVELEARVLIPGVPIPITVDGESLTTSGGYTFNADSTYTFDWESDISLLIPILGPDTMLIEQDGAGTYVVIGENQIELDQNGTKTIMDLISKSSTRIVTEFEDNIVVFDTLNAEVDVQAILSK